MTLDRAVREMLLPFLQTLQASSTAEAQVRAAFPLYAASVSSTLFSACARARARVCARACVRACVCVCARVNASARAFVC